MAQSQNRILNSLPQNIFVAVKSHLKHIDLVSGAVVAETNQPVNLVYFPDTGVISLVVEMIVGDMIETAMVGRDGVVIRRNAPAFGTSRWGLCSRARRNFQAVRIKKSRGKLLGLAEQITSATADWTASLSDTAPSAVQPLLFEYLDMDARLASVFLASLVDKLVECHRT